MSRGVVTEMVGTVPPTWKLRMRLQGVATSVQPPAHGWIAVADIIYVWNESPHPSAQGAEGDIEALYPSVVHAGMRPQY